MPKMKNIYIFFVLMVNSYNIRWCTDGKCEIKMIAKKNIYIWTSSIYRYFYRTYNLLYNTSILAKYLGTAQLCSWESRWDLDSPFWPTKKFYFWLNTLVFLNTTTQICLYVGMSANTSKTPLSPFFNYLFI